MPRVTVVLVTWNSANLLTDCLASLRQQAFRDFSVQVVDNASSDATVPIVREMYPEARILSNFRNLGFCRAVNQGIALSQSEYVLLLTPDVELQRECLRSLVAFADQHPTAASFSPKLLRWERAVNESGESNAAGAPAVIDCAGLQMRRSRRAVNRGEGQPDTGQFEQPEQVFGCSGACALYRTVMLKNIAVEGQCFDEDFFAYKEDVDVAWRLRLAGFDAWYVPTAIGAHHRQVRAARRGLWHGVWGRRRVPATLRVLSVKNQYLMLVKNEQLQNAWRDVLFLVFPLIGIVGLSLTVEPFLWRAFASFRRQLPAAFRKRKHIQQRAVVRPAEMRKWFGGENSKFQIPNKFPPTGDHPQGDKYPKTHSSKAGIVKG